MDTIVAISTPLAKGAISIIRMSGEESASIAKKIANLPLDYHLQPRYARLSNLYDKDGILIDKAIMIYFKSPGSFSGEDIIEFQTHGGIIISQQILETCLHFGARIAKAGEFSYRALMNGKMDLVQLEATVAMINNNNMNLAKLLTRNLEGKLSQLLEKSRTKILEVVAQIEINIDYADEDLDDNIISQALDNIESIIKSFDNILNATKQYHKLQNLKLCIIGRPNVGKSSILNLLLMKNRAIVSDISGTTRDIITEYIDINGNLISIADTAGIRQSNDIIESEGIKRSFEYAKDSDIILCVFDVSDGMQKEDLEILDLCKKLDKIILVVLNKNDLSHVNNYDFSSFDTISINTKDDNNAKILRDKIADLITMQIDTQTLVLTNNTQITLLKDSLNHLKEAINLLKNGNLELSSLELTNALKLIGNITKPYNVEDMLDSMFSQFCVGK